MPSATARALVDHHVRDWIVDHGASGHLGTPRMTATAVLTSAGCNVHSDVERAAGARRLLAGKPAKRSVRRTLAEHRQRLGRRPIGGECASGCHRAQRAARSWRAWFPTYRKWRGVSRLALERGPVVVVANASEGEPLSAKDRLLAEKRPHLLIDGALIAAEAVGADDVVIYVSRPARRATRALRQALGERQARRIQRAAYPDRPHAASIRRR